MKKKEEKIYSSEEVWAKIEETKKKWKEEYDKIPAHGFKKGDRLWQYHPKYKLHSMIKVVDCREKILLVKDFEYSGSIPYRVEPEDFKHLTKMTSKEYNRHIRGKILGPPTNGILKATFWIQRKLGLSHTRNPQTISDYAGNWGAFVVTFFARLHSYVYDPSPNTFKGLNAHGPLWKGQKIEE